MPENNKIQSFLDTVYKSAEEKSRSMIREIDAAGENAYKTFCEEAEAAADIKIKREMSRIQVTAAAEQSQEEREIRSALFKRRVEITDEVFSEVLKKLSKYRQTEDYAKSLKNDAVRLSDLLDGSEAVIYIGEKDSDRIDDIKSAVGKIKVEISQNIKIGGVLGVFGNRIYDCTLDSKFSEAKAEFIEKSGLKVI